MSLSVTDTSSASKPDSPARTPVEPPLPASPIPDAALREVEIIIAGSGFSGLGAAIKLKQAGHHDFIVIDRGSDVGGTWRDNTYPGAACDVPSQLYSYSFATNKEWSRSFSPQPEIQAYIRSVSEQYDVRSRHLFNTEMYSAHWDPELDRWIVETSSGTFRGKYLVSGVGALTEPQFPDIKGLADFGGTIFHSARWNHDYNLVGKRVAVIGTGASAIQIVPQVQRLAAHLDLFQRTPPWIVPRVDREYTKAERLAYRYIPGLPKLARLGVYLERETQVVGLTRIPALMKPLEWAARAHLRTQVHNKALRRLLTPEWSMGCKRMLISNTYYPAVASPNVDLITAPIVEVTEDAVLTGDGKRHPVDAIIVATGFHVTDSPTHKHVFGKDGRSLSEVFDDEGMAAYKGTTIANFPNLFVLMGPNVGLGHSSMVYMIESQITYLVDAVSRMKEYGLDTFEPRKSVQDQWNQDLHAQMDKTIWATGGCMSWYNDKNGNNTTLWPGWTLQFRNATRHFDLVAYDVTKTADRAASPRKAAVL